MPITGGCRKSLGRGNDNSIWSIIARILCEMSKTGAPCLFQMGRDAGPRSY